MIITVAIALAIGAAGKGLDAAGLAEQVVDGIGVEMIEAEIVLTAFEREIGWRAATACTQPRRRQREQLQSPIELRSVVAV